MEDIVEEVLFWELAVVCFVVGANPPLHVINGFAKHIWKNLSIDKVGMVEKSVFLVGFKSIEDHLTATAMNDILFNKKPLIVKPWSP